MDNSNVKNWKRKLQGCLIFDFPVAKFANHDPSASIAPGIDSDLPPALSPSPSPSPVPVPVPVPFPESSSVALASPDFEAFWLKKEEKNKLLAFSIYIYIYMSLLKNVTGWLP